MADTGPHLRFPSAPRERIAIASYPFRDFIVSKGETPSASKMEVKDFAAHVNAKFNIRKIEPWSEHFQSLDPKYLGEIRSAVKKVDGAIVNIAVDGKASPYAVDRGERDRAVAFAKQWVDAAAAVGSPSIRTNIPATKDSHPDVERTAASLKVVADYASTRSVVVNLENDNPAVEDPFFLINVIKSVGSPWLHALPDFGNTLAHFDEQHAYRGIDAMFAYAYNICHVKETEVPENARAVHVDLARTFGYLKQHGYAGYCSMEWDSPGVPYEGTRQLIDKTVRYL